MFGDARIGIVKRFDDGRYHSTIKRWMTDVEGASGGVAEAATEDAMGSCDVGRWVSSGDIGNRGNGSGDERSGDNGSGDVGSESMCGVEGGRRHTTINRRMRGDVVTGAFFLRRRWRLRRKRRTRWRWRCRSKWRMEGRWTVGPGSQPGQRRSAAARSDTTIRWRKRSLTPVRVTRSAAK